MSGMTKKPSRYAFREFEFRNGQAGTLARGSARNLVGYAAVFDASTRIDDWDGTYDEQIARGAFRKTLSEKRPVLQFDHGHDARTGSVPIGSIDEIHEDATGLYVSASLFDNQVVEPIRQAIEAGSISGMSFRFRVVRDQWSKQQGDVDMRTIREVELFELGPVVFPAYAQTSVGVRSMLARLDQGERASLLRDLEMSLDSGRGLSPGQRAAALRGLDLQQTLGR